MIREKLVKDNPIVTAYQSDLAGSHGRLSFCSLFARQPKEALAAAKKGIDTDPRQDWIMTNLAHGYLFDGQFEQAKTIYLTNKDVKLDDRRTFAQAVLDDFKQFRAKGLTHPDMEKIEAYLKQ